MSDEPKAETGQGGQKAAEDAWAEVGRQFQALGESLAAAFRSSWDSEEGRKRRQEVGSNLESVVREVDEAITKASTSPQMEQVRSDVNKVAGALRDAGEHTIKEVQPQVLSALRQLSDELQKVIAGMEKKTPPPAEPPAGGGETKGT